MITTMHLYIKGLLCKRALKGSMEKKVQEIMLAGEEISKITLRIEELAHKDIYDMRLTEVAEMEILVNKLHKRICRG